jgi:4-hydroxy-3-polyprenylbenzoate decarboxylase
MYGGGIKSNFRAVVKAMTFRKGGIFQHATIGGCRHRRRRGAGDR